MAAFVAGAAAAVGVNQVLDVHLAQKRPQVESEPIFVALRSLAQGAPVTVWDVALRDWPKAMLPTTAMRADDSFEGCILRHPLREGQPLLKVQLVRDAGQSRADSAPQEATFVPPAAAPAVAQATEADLWAPAPAGPAAEPAVSTTTAAPAAAQPTTSADVAPPVAVAMPDDPADAATEPAVDEPAPIAAAVEPTPVAAVQEPTLAEPQPGEPTPADTPPPVDAGVESVVAARSVTTTAPEPVASAPVEAPAADAAQTPKSRDGVVRYLVVPERVALQADAGFGTPAPVAPPQPAAPAVQQPAPAARNRSAQAGQRPGQPTTQPRSRSQMSSPATQSRTQATQSRTQATQPRSQAAQPRRQAAPPTTRQPTAAAPRGFGGMFPNIAAGIDAMTGRKPRAADGGYDEAVATDAPSEQVR